mgnify:CR=1 FL=1
MKSLKTLCILIIAISCSHTYAAELESDKQKLSYSMGVFFGQTVTRQKMDLDVPAFMQAVEDMLKGAETKIPMSEMQQILADYQKKEQEQRTAQANTNKSDGMKYLEENKKKEGVKTLEGGLQYKVIKMGDGKKPVSNSTIVVHYRGTLIDGTEFDSSYSRGEPATLGLGRVIRGWQIALQEMPVGSKWQIVVPPDLGYGEQGAGGIIGPNATLLFDIELLEIK